MSTQSSIEWTDMKWNPTCGCSRISPGCENYYAEDMGCRLKGVAINKQGRQEATGRFAHYIDVIGSNGRWNENMKLVDEALLDPFKWRRPQMVFANSMSDLFHKNLSIDDIRKVCKVMAATDWHIYQVLTKRADILSAALNGPLREYADCRHIW